MEKKKTKSWVRKRAEEVKELAAKPEDPSLVPESCNLSFNLKYRLNTQPGVRTVGPL